MHKLEKEINKGIRKIERKKRKEINRETEKKL
jgi:hypothetical protein